MSQTEAQMGGTEAAAVNAAGTIPFIQINLHHSRSASTVLSKCMAEMRTGIALIQEPWITAKGDVAGLGGCGTLLRPAGPRVRTCILLKGLQGEIWPKHCNADLTTATVKVKLGSGEEMALVIASAYFPSDAVEAPPPEEVRALIEDCQRQRKEVIIGCDANAHHTVWGSTNCNDRGEELLHYVVSTDLDFLNKGCVPTFRNAIREEVLDITLASRGIYHRIAGWRVIEGVSMSDHEQIHFRLEDARGEVQMWRNPRKTNWDGYLTHLKDRLPGPGENPRTTGELEEYCGSILNAITGAFESNCRVRKRRQDKGAPWWHPGLDALRKEVRKRFRVWRKRRGATELENYKTAQRSYKNALEKARREGWRRFCEELDSVPEVARLNRVLSRPSGGASGQIRKPDGEWAADNIEALDCLLDAHFPGLDRTGDGVTRPETVPEYLEQDWDTAEKVITSERIRWAVNSFEPYKAPGADGIFPALLQKGIDLLVEPLEKVFKACLALGYIPKEWRRSKVIFLPKPGRSGHQSAKDYRPISLTSFLLKTLERLVDRHIKDESLRTHPLHPTQHAYREGRSTDSALDEATKRIKKGMMRKRGMVLAAFLDVEGAFNFTTERSICRGAQRHGVPAALVRWIRSSLTGRIIEAHWGSHNGGGRAGRGCPQGGVLSPTLWSLVIDELLRRLNELGIYAQAYADDVVILVFGDDEATLAGLMRLALRVVEKWCREVELTVNPSKTVLVNFTRRYKVKPLGPIKLFGEELSLSKSVKYLGVTFDSRLNWGEHLRAKSASFIATFWACRRAFSTTWGLKPRMVKWLYTAVLRPRLLHGAIAWWPRCKMKIGITALGRLQGLVMRGIAGVRRSTPLKVLEMALDLPPLELMVRSTAFKARIRIGASWHDYEDEDIVKSSDLGQLCGTLDKEPRSFFFSRKFEVAIPSRSEWRYEEPAPEKVYWFTDGSKDENGVGAGAWLMGSSRELVLSLDGYCTVFQAEVRAIRSCVEVMLNEGWENRQVVLYSDSKAALSALRKVEVTSKEVRQCREALDKLAERCDIVLHWVPGHAGVIGNEKADRLAKRGAAGIRAARTKTPIPFCVMELGIQEWVRKEQLKGWKSYQGCRHAKALIGDSMPNGWVKGLIELSRREVRRTVEWLTGHCNLRYHGTKTGRCIQSSCRLCGEQEETPVHLLCFCPRLMGCRRGVCGEFLLEPGDISSLSLRQLLDLLGSIIGAIGGG